MSQEFYVSPSSDDSISSVITVSLIKSALTEVQIANGERSTEEGVPGYGSAAL